MKPVLETERLRLRELTVDDAENFFELNSDEAVIRYTGDAPFADVAAARSFLEGYQPYAETGYGRWAVVRKADGAFLGWCGLKRHDDGETDLGFRLFRRYWGHGYATEAAVACLHVAFDRLGLDSVIGRTLQANAASVRVLEKAGMKERQPAVFHGEPAWIYRLRRAEWEPGLPPALYI
jgi:ribosomal-protein-alanine N-acetyltransferase